MTKISLLAALTLASVCSAVDLYTDEDFQGDYCMFATPIGDCIQIPEPCYGQVSSMSSALNWRCSLYDYDGCYDRPNVTFTGPIPSLNFNGELKYITCWTSGRGPKPKPHSERAMGHSNSERLS
ncbi:MAG: hypothetical protein J3Q66DRAFT_369666 [Benniella sp.]|nr:MAG: hypothetical protein J3Q66DRAFT_369666 [Benniella sp.]